MGCQPSSAPEWTHDIGPDLVSSGGIFSLMHLALGFHFTKAGRHGMAQTKGKENEEKEGLHAPR